MNRLLLMVIVWSVAVITTAGAAVPGGRIAVVFPPEKSVVEGALINLVVKNVQELADELQVTVNGRRQPVARKSLDKFFACYDGVSLASGMNDIRVAGYKDGKKVDETSVQVFFRSNLSPGSSGIPAGFKRYLFHTDANEKGCVPCHTLNFSKSERKVQNPADSPCAVCHKKILAGRTYLHVPAADWSCLACHDGKSRNPKLGVTKPDIKSCTSCHEKNWLNSKYMHGPTAAGECTVCHNPHAGSRQFFLKSDVGDLCLACHDEILSRPHILSSLTLTGGHPVFRSSDPFNPTRELNCASCHNPHGSDSLTFLKGHDESQSMEHFCRSCHKM